MKINMLGKRFELQGHRGARGLKPENTLPSFETALDCMVSAIETDVHRTRDGHSVLYHDEALSENRVRRKNSAVPFPAQHPRIAELTLAELREYIADRNPEPGRFPSQNNAATPVAQAFATERGIDAYAIPTLQEFISFLAAYAGDPGRQAGKTDRQRARANEVRLALEPKRVPFRPEYIGDRPGELERELVRVIRDNGLAERTTVQCFDNRVIHAIRALEPAITGAVLTANTAPASIPALAQAADATVYCPDFLFVDAAQIEEAHAAGIRVIPYTVNEAEDIRLLLDWGVDGLITDFPDRPATLLQERGIAF